MNYPKVSIIIPVYNGKDYLKEAIDSALSQTYENVEIIVINDGSDDNDATRTIAESYGNKIRYYEKKNGGTSSALNFGIKKMTGEYFTWLSHDDIYLPERIMAHMSEIIKSDKNMVVHSNCWRWINSKELHPFYEYSVIDAKIWRSTSMALIFGMVNGLSLTFHRSYFEKFGYFDEKLKTTQDYAKWYEMFRDIEITNIDGYYVKNRIHNQQQGATKSELWIRECESLFCKIIQDFHESEAETIGIDFFTLLGMASIRFGNIGCVQAANIAESRQRIYDEPTDAIERRHKLKSKLFDSANSVYLYCMGKRGKTLLRAFYLRGIKIDGFSDQKTEIIGQNEYEVNGVQVEDIPKDCLLIVTKEFPDDLVEEFIGKGYKNVITYDDILIDLMMTPVDKTKLTESI